TVYVYFTSATANTVWRARRDGTGALETLTTNAAVPVDTQVRPPDLYFVNGGSTTDVVMRMPPTGSATPTRVATDTQPAARALAFTSTDAYWVNQITRQVNRVNLATADGGAPVPLWTLPNTGAVPYALAIRDGEVWVATQVP